MKNYITEVMSDIEGCWLKVQTFMEESDIFYILDNNASHKITFKNFPQVGDFNFSKIQMKENSSLVMLGDTTGNGNQNIQVLAFLKYIRTMFHKTWNREIVFIVGNRDTAMLLYYKKFINFEKNNKFIEQVQQEIKNIHITAVKNLYSEDDKNPNYIFYYMKHGDIVSYNKYAKSLYVHGGLNCLNFQGLNIEEWVKNTNNHFNANLIHLWKTEKKIGQIYYSVKDIVEARPWGNYNIGIGGDSNKCSLNYKDIKYIFSGHTPIGQLPVILKENGLTRVFCDTSRTGRSANIKLVENLTKNKVYVKIIARYDKTKNLEFEKNCEESNIKYVHSLRRIKYSSKDSNTGMIKNGKLIIVDDIYATWHHKSYENNDTTDYLDVEYYDN